VNGETLFIFEGTFTPQEPRSYTIVAGGRDAFLNLLEARKSFLAAQGGAGNEERLEGPPSIISDSAVPRNGDTGVPVTQVMSVQFTEPVTNVFSGTVTFEELGETRDDPPRPHRTKIGGGGPAFTDEVVANDPLRGSSSAKYRLTFSTLIVDTDLSPTGEPDPKPLREETSTIEFETFRPTKLGEATLDATLVAMTTLDNYAFVALIKGRTALSGIGAFDLSDLSRRRWRRLALHREHGEDVDVKRGVGSDVLGVLSFNPRQELGAYALRCEPESLVPLRGFVTTVVPERSDFQVDLHEDSPTSPSARGSKS
jgi:hypothetical protein